MYHTLEAQKVLDDDSSKILLFFTSSTFNLSRQKPTLYQTLKVDELQPLQKGVVISWLGPLTATLWLIPKYTGVKSKFISPPVPASPNKLIIIRRNEIELVVVKNPFDRLVIQSFDTVPANGV